MDESGEEDCTIYIEELKSDDQNLKMNAVSKVCSIGGILGPVRVCNELVPYLIEIIEEQDNEDEFLIKLSTELLALKDYVGGKEKQYTLIAPLEILSSMEEPLVREKAVNCLIELSEDQSINFFQGHFFQIVQQLGQWDNFPSRISAVSLLPVIYPHLDDDQQQTLWELFVTLCSDDTPMVRRTCGSVMSKMASLESIRNSDSIVQALLEQWQKLLKDKIDSVKIQAVEASPQVLRLILGQKSVIDEHMKGYFALVNKNEKSWRVRYTVPELFPQIIKYLDKETLKSQGIPALECLLKDTEQEVRSIAIQNAYYILSELPTQLSSQFIPQISGLATDTSSHVRLSLADQLCKLASIFNQETMTNQFIPIISQLFKDEVQDIKTKIGHNLPQLSQALGPELSKKHLIPFIINFPNEKQWRVRLEIVSIVPKLVKVAGYEAYQELHETLYEKGILNHYQAIRDQAIENFVTLKEIFGYDKMKNHIIESITGLSTQNNYIYRVTSLQAITKLKTVLSAKDLNGLFETVSTRLLNDPVPNVKLNVFKCFQQVQESLDQKVRNDFVKKAKKFENDPDSDVSYFAANCSLKN